MQNNRDKKLITTERRRNCLVPEPNYHTIKLFKENLLVIEMRKKKQTKEILMNKPVYLGLPILELSKNEFWYD